MNARQMYEALMEGASVEAIAGRSGAPKYWVRTSIRAYAENNRLPLLERPEQIKAHRKSSARPCKGALMVIGGASWWEAAVTLDYATAESARISVTDWCRRNLVTLPVGAGLP